MIKAVVKHYKQTLVTSLHQYICSLFCLATILPYVLDGVFFLFISEDKMCNYGHFTYLKAIITEIK